MRTPVSFARPRTLGALGLVLSLLLGAYALGAAVADSGKLPPPAAPIVLDGQSIQPTPSQSPLPSKTPPARKPAPKVRTNAPAPPVVKPTPRQVDRDSDDDGDDDDDRDDHDDEVDDD